MANWMGVIEGAGKVANAAINGFTAKQQAKENRKQAIADYNFASMQNRDEQLRMQAYQAAASVGDLSGLSILTQPQGLPQIPTSSPSNSALNSAADISNTIVSAAENGGPGVVEPRLGKDAQSEPTGSTKVVEEVTSKEEGGRLRKRFSVSSFKRKIK